MGTAAAPGIGQVLWPVLGMLGSSAIGALTMPDAQELQSFEGEGSLDPRSMFNESRSSINDMIGLLKARANRPVSLRSSYVQQPPVFAGGGMPMPIGLTGEDPALFDPSLLTLPGLSGADQGGVVDRSFPPRLPEVGEGDGGGGGDDSGRRPPQGGEIIIDDGGGERNGPMNMAGLPRRRDPFAASGRGSYQVNVSQHDDLAQGGDDLAQGMGAVELLLRSMAPLARGR